MKRFLFMLAMCSLAIGRTEAVRAELADLGSTPERYSGKSVVVSGEVYSGPEMTVMHVPSAANAPQPELMLVTISEAVSDKRSRPEKRFFKQLRRSGKVRATLQGKFESAQSRAFGHQACCRFKLTVEDIIAVQ